MKRNVQLVSFVLNKDLEKKLRTLMRSEKAVGYRIAGSFCPPVTDGKIRIVFVLEKGAP